MAERKSSENECTPLSPLPLSSQGKLGISRFCITTGTVFCFFTPAVVAGGGSKKSPGARPCCPGSGLFSRTVYRASRIQPQPTEMPVCKCKLTASVLLGLLGSATGQLQASALSWTLVYPPLTFSPTARSYPVMSRNSTHLFVLGGEGGTSAGSPTALVYNISESARGRCCPGTIFFGNFHSAPLFNSQTLARSSESTPLVARRSWRHEQPGPSLSPRSIRSYFRTPESLAQELVARTRLLSEA